MLYGLLTVDGWSLALRHLETGEQKILVPGATIGRYLPSGHLVYTKGNGIFVVRFEAESLTTIGAPVSVVDGLPTKNWANGEYTLFAVSDAGTLAYIAGESDPSGQMILVERDGAIMPLADHSTQAPRFAPDGDLVAAGDAGQIWLHDLSRGGTRSRLTSGAPRYVPVWTPDGSRLAVASYESGPADLHWISASDPTDSEPLLKGENRTYPVSFSADGELLAYIEIHPESLSDIWVLPINGDRTPMPVVRTEFNEYHARFSPDGRWLAYVSEKTGAAEVYVQGYPEAGRPVRLSSNGGTSPAWRGDGRELFFRSGNRIMLVSVSPGKEAPFGSPETLVEPPFAAPAFATGSHFDVSPDGQRFVVIAAEERTPKQLRLVLNWSAELGTLLPDD